VILGTVFLEQYSVGLNIEDYVIGVGGYVQHLPPEGKPYDEKLWILWLCLGVGITLALGVVLYVCCSKDKPI
jgi:hypothetical protein